MRNCARVENLVQSKSKMLIDDEKDIYLDVTWNNKIAFVHLEDGCYLVGYENHKMKGKTVYLVKEPHYLQNHELAYVIPENGFIDYDYKNFLSGYWCRCTK